MRATRILAPVLVALAAGLAAGLAHGQVAEAHGAANASPAILVAAMSFLVHPKNLLENRIRASIHHTIAQEPGITVGELSRTLGVTHQTVAYHLQLLKKAGYVTDHSQGNRRLLFVNGDAMPDEQRQLVSVTKDEVTMAVLHLIARSPWILRKEVAIALGLTRTAGAWHINKLVRLNVVCEHKERRHSFLYVRRGAYERVLELAGGQTPGGTARPAHGAP